MSSQAPPPKGPLVDEDRIVTFAWLRWFQSLVSSEVGSLAAIPEQFDHADADITLGSSGFGSYVDITGAIAFAVTRIVVTVEINALNAGVYPLDVEIVVDPTGTPAKIGNLHIEAATASNNDSPQREVIEFSVAVGQRIGARGSGNLGTPSINVHVAYYGPE